MVDVFGPPAPLNLPTNQRRHGQTMTTLFEDGERANLNVLQRDADGELVVVGAIASFSDLILARVDERDFERVQTILSDNPKLYAFGRDHRIYGASAVLLDTDLTDTIEIGNKKWTGRSAAEWREFYKKYASLHVCAQSRYMIQFSYARRVLYGAIVDMQLSSLSMKPNEVELLFNFYVSFGGTVDYLE